MNKKLKYLNFAKYATYAYIFLILLASYLIMQSQNISVSELFKQNPFLTVGYGNALINFLIYPKVDEIIKNYESNPKKQATQRTHLIVLAMVSILTFNVVALLLFVLSMANYYPHLTNKQALNKLKVNNQLKPLLKQYALIFGLIILNLVMLVALLINFKSG